MKKEGLIKKSKKHIVNTKKISSKKGLLSLSQILILVIWIIAIGYAIGSSIGEVSGESCDEEGCYNIKSWRDCPEIWT